MFIVFFKEFLMGKNIFLLFVLMFILFTTACSEDEEEGIFVGAACSSEGAETCSDDGVYVLLCQSSVWALKYHCNISIGKHCGQNSTGAFGCFGGNIEDYSDSDTSDQDTDEPDTNDTSDTENETPDGDTTSEDPADTDDTDSATQTDTDNTDDQDNEVTGNDSDNDSDNDTDTDTDTDSDTDNDPTEPPAGQCSSNYDCSGTTTPYCSLSTSECIANAVFITEYVEGSSYNKAIEIYNGSKSPVNLSNFTIQQANNGKDWGTTNYIYSFPDSVQLNSGALYVVCKSGAGPELSAKCDDTALSGSTFDFNGDDGIALFEGSSILDQLGGDPANYEYWSVAGVSNAMVDHTLRRKTTVIKGTTDWTTSAGTTEENSEWAVLAKDTFDGLGTR